MFVLASILTASLTLPGSLGDNPYAVHPALHNPDHEHAVVETVDPQEFSRINSPAESIFDDDFGN